MPSAASRHEQTDESLRSTRNGTGYKRTYKACDSCRKTKAKCVREESSVSCLKCTRERRECVFPAYRSTKRARLDQEIPVVQEAARPQSDAAYPTRSTLEQSALDRDLQVQDGLQHDSLLRFSSTSLAHPHQSVGAATKAVPGPLASIHAQTNRPSAPSTSTTFTDGHSRMALSPQNPRHPENAARMNSLQDHVVQTVVASSSDAVGLLFRAANAPESEGSEEADGQEGPGTGPQLSLCATDIVSPSLNIREPVAPDILYLWNQHRFVRQGWFTAREAVAYVHAFFTKQSPLSPILDGFYADPANHQRLILEEPLLCCTILMISSRHHYPPGASGAVRADYIHGRLWRHIEHLVQRITFGSEKYSISKSRTLGSIQALLLMTEWHPRTLHFPPEYDGWDSSLAPSVDDSYTTPECTSDASKRWREDVFEPAKRSDRLSWMLVGLATTLAHELGVFKIPDEADDIESNVARASKLSIRRLLYLYVTQLSLRLGCSSIFPQEALQNTALPEALSKSTPAKRDNGALILSKWLDLTTLLATAADVFFSSRSAIRQMLRGPRYLNMINHFQPLLDSWYKDYLETSHPTTTDSSRKILLMDYYYARIYIHSVAIQALVNRISDRSSGDDLWQHHEILRSKHAQDFASVNEVRESSGKILEMAVELSDEGVLQYCPVRVFLRIVSASVFLLKSMSLGSRETDIIASLKTLDSCIAALQMNRADDIHLAGQYATLIGRHVQRFKKNFQVRNKSFGLSNMSPYRTRASSPTAAGGMPDAQNQDRLAIPQDQQFTSSQPLGNMPEQSSYDMFPSAGLNGGQTEFSENELMEDWLAQPFNPQVAPFGVDHMAMGGGLALDSLDFLWNLGDQA